MFRRRSILGARSLGQLMTIWQERGISALEEFARLKGVLERLPAAGEFRAIRDWLGAEYLEGTPEYWNAFIKRVVQSGTRSYDYEETEVLDKLERANAEFDRRLRNAFASIASAQALVTSAPGTVAMPGTVDVAPGEMMEQEGSAIGTVAAIGAGAVVLAVVLGAL